MFPAAFDYHAPPSLEEACALLAQHGDEAKVMAGGQSLIPLLKLRLAAPAVVIDIGRVPGLARVQTDDGEVRIGALTRHVDVERDGVLQGVFPMMAQAARQISDPLIRNRGTLCGSVCHADPSGDWGSVMLALDGRVVARSSSSERTIPVAALFDGPFTTTLRPDEVVTEVRIPRPRTRAGGAYVKLERKVGDFATVAVATQLEIADGRIVRAGIGLTAVGPTNIRAARAEQALLGERPDEATIAGAARLAAEEADPHDDIRGSAEYKRDVVRVFVQRGLRAAAAQAMEVG